MGKRHWKKKGRLLLITKNCRYNDFLFQKKWLRLKISCLMLKKRSVKMIIRKASKIFSLHLSSMTLREAKLTLRKLKSKM